MAKNTIFCVLLELIGSLVLGFAISEARNSTRAYGGFVGMWLMIGAYATCYRATGGSLNPALTLANILRPDKLPGYDLATSLMLIPAQIIGFMLGVLFRWWVEQVPGELRFKSVATNDDSLYFSEGTCFQFLAATILAIVYLTQTGKTTCISKDTGIQTFAISVAHTGLIVWSLSWAGGGINPAYAWAQDFWDLMDDGDKQSMYCTFIYIGCAFGGMLLALAMYAFVFIKAYDVTANEEINEETNKA